MLIVLHCAYIKNPFTNAFTCIQLILGLAKLIYSLLLSSTWYLKNLTIFHFSCDFYHVSGSKQYGIVKNFGGKKVWRIRTVGSLAEKTWQIEVHLHRECYGNSQNW